MHVWVFRSPLKFSTSPWRSNSVIVVVDKRRINAKGSKNKWMTGRKQTKMPADNWRFTFGTTLWWRNGGSSPAEGSAKMNVCRPHERQCKPQLRQADRMLCATLSDSRVYRERVVRKRRENWTEKEKNCFLKILNIFALNWYLSSLGKRRKIQIVAEKWLMNCLTAWLRNLSKWRGT